jgi:hypothetical protein
MRKFARSLSVSALLAAGFASPAWPESAGLLSADQGGAAGYQHSVERSRFVAGRSVDELRTIKEFGFSKIVGTTGVAATNLRNGLFIATQNGGADKDAASPPGQDTEKPGYPLDPDRHNDMVMKYFVSAGVPREQVGGVHANTYLSGGGESGALARRVDGYASVLERVVGDHIPVAESIAWARLDRDGKSISEWVYWPAIPAKALADARRLAEQMTGPGKEAYLARLPAGLTQGTVVIHHSPATDEGSFEALATYDVVDNPGTPQAHTEKLSTAPAGVAVVRHFDVDGAERRLPSERFDLGQSDARAKP